MTDQELVSTIGVEPPGKYTISPTLSQRDAPLPVQLTHSSKNMPTLHANTTPPPVTHAYAHAMGIFLLLSLTSLIHTTTGKQDNTQQDNLAVIMAWITHTYTPRKTICHWLTV